MRHQYFFKAFLALITPLTLLSQKTIIDAQKTNVGNVVSSKQLEDLPFGKGKWNLLLDRNLNYSDYNSSSEGTKLGSTSNFGIKVGTNYFVADHFAIGLELGYRDKKSVVDQPTTSYTQTTSHWNTNVSALYMNEFSPNSFYYIQGGVGIGGISNSSGLGSTLPSNENIFNYKAEVGFPFHTCNGSPVYLTPYVAYDYSSTTYSGYKDLENRFDVGVHLETYLSCSDFCEGPKPYSKNMYDLGRNFIGICSNTCFGFGSEKITYSGSLTSSSNKYDLSNYNIRGDYDYYILKDFAVGASLGFDSKTQKASDGSDKTTTQSFMFTPMIQLNLPVTNSWENFYIQGNFGFGTTKTDNTTTGQTTTQKENINRYGLGVGYSLFFTPKLAFTPAFDYKWENLKNTETSITEKQNGFGFDLGVRYYW